MAKKKKEQIPKINKKEIKNKNKKNMFCKAWYKMIYLPNGEFSITRIIMIIGVFQATLVLLTSFFLGLFSKTILPDALYNYSFKILSLTIGQYAATKVKNSFDNKIDKNIPKI